MNRLGSLFFWSYFFFQSISVTANTESGKFLIRHYSDEVYKAHPVNWCSVKDNNGTIYFGNRSVVVAYDGVEWKKIRIQLGAPVYDMKKGPEGKIYLGTQNDFGYLKTDSTGNITFQSLVKLLPQEFKEFGIIWKVHVIEKAVYFQSPKWLFKWENNRFKTWSPESSFHFSFEVNNQLYIKDKSLGLLILEDEKLKLISTRSKGVDFSSNIYSMFPYDSSRILIAARNKGLFLYNPDTDSISEFHTDADDLLQDSNIYGGLVLRDGNYALNTLKEGVLIFNQKGEIIRKINQNSGLKTQDIRHLFQDKQGGLWLSSNEGVYRVGLDIPLTYWDADDGLKGSLNHLIEYQEQNYLATSKGVFVMHGNSFTKVKGLDNVSWRFQVINNNNQTKLLVATSAGVFQVNESSAIQLTDFPCSYLYASPQLPDVLWVSEKEDLGLYIFRKKNLVKVGVIPTIKNIVKDIEEDQKQNIWIGTDFGGLYKIKPIKNLESLTGPSFKIYGLNHGLRKIEEIRVEILGDSIVLLSGHNTYLYDQENDNFKTLNISKTQNPHDSLETIFIDIDAKGTYWVQRNEKDYNLLIERAFLDGERFLMETIPFKMIPRKLARQVIDKPDGSCWIVFNNALFRYDPLFNYVKEKNHITLINKIVTNQDTVFKSTVLPNRQARNWGLPDNLPFKFNDLTFHFNSSCLRNEESNKYQYKLIGDENRWSTWSDQPVAYFTNLHEGGYKFMVRSKGFDEIPGEISVYSFSISPPWYRSLFVFLIYFILGLLFIWTLLKLNTSRIRKSNELLEEKVNIRTAEIVDQNIKIRLQQKEIITQNEELQLLNKEKNFLLGAVAHDLKNPLNSIYSISQLIKMDDKQLGDEQVEYINQIEHISLRLTEKVNEILDVTVIDANQNKVPLKRGEMSSLVNEIVRNLQPVAIRKNIRLVYENPETKYFASFEKNYMRKAIQNLLDNAIKFSPKNKEIYINLSHPEDKLRLMIRDQGPGITEKDRKRLFQRFTTLTARPTNGEKSTGLGLSIVKRCVEAMNGKVWCESIPGEGATFFIEI